MLKSLIKYSPTLFALNGTIGSLPIILCMILSEFTAASASLYICTALGMLTTLFILQQTKLREGALLLFLCTGLLGLFSISTFIPVIAIPKGMLPFYLEIGTLIIVSILLHEKRAIKKMFLKNRCACYDKVLSSNIDTVIRGSKLIRTLCIPHFIITGLLLIFYSPLSKITDMVLLHILPPAILFSAFFGYQLFILLLFYLSKSANKIPVLDEKGEVVGQKFDFEAIYYNNKYINPVIRFAIISDGKLFLSRRSEKLCFNPCKIDLPIEIYLRYDESLQEGVNRIMNKVFPEEPTIDPRFSIKYRFKTKDTNRLIYLYIIHVEDEFLLCSPTFQDGKLWTIKQIETNLEKNFFGECFEKEYEQLKDALLIDEKYK